MEKLTKYFLPITSFILVIAFFRYFSQFGLQTYQIIAINITIIGYLLWIYSRYSLGKFYSLLPQAHKIVTTGIYSKISHPVYFSQMVVLGGFFLFVGQILLWGLFISILLIQIYRIRQEEKILIQKFGNQYLEYKKSTWF